MARSEGHSEDLPSAIAALQQALKERLVAVILFGSRARGDASDASDWDLLVIAEGLPSKTLERYFFYQTVAARRVAGASVLAPSHARRNDTSPF